MRRLKHTHIYLVCAPLLLLGGLRLQGEGVEPGPLSAALLEQAAREAGFRVHEVVVDSPRSVRPAYSLTGFGFDDPQMAALRERYRLRDVVSGASDEWTAQLKLKQWVHERIPGGDPRVTPRHALEILDLAARGEKFYCTYYTVTYTECAQALGWQARKLGIDRRHGPEGMESTHHGVAEVWSNQFAKWVVVDPQSNLHFEKDGVPLSAWEIRAEWLRNQGKDVAHVVGVPPASITRNPAIVWWERKDEDETATYFWIYISNDSTSGADDGSSGLIFPQDAAHAGETWYQNDDQTRRGVLHPGYTNKRFRPTNRIEDAYWTVGLTEVQIKGVSRGVILLGLDSYCPHWTAYEASYDADGWRQVEDAAFLKWKLKKGWNKLRLRTKNAGEVRGPETRLALLLE
jgi:hypothetical protein